MESFSRTVSRFFKSRPGQIALLLFVGLTAWRIYLFNQDVAYRDYANQVWAASYQAMALWGALCGLFFVRLWGGTKSVVGRANLAFALGLFLQLFGQSTFSYFFYTGIDVPYPSVADIGFFGSIPFYIYGALALIKASGGKFSLKSMANKMQAVLIPLVILGFSYFMFLRGYEFDWSQPLKIFLDFGYPLGEAMYVSLAILAFSLSQKMLGGAMRTPMLMFIIALLGQYTAEFTFLYQSNAGTFVGGGIADYLYLVSYFLMTVALIELGITHRVIEET